MDNKKRLIDANELLAKVAASKNNNTHTNGRLRMNHMCEHDRFMRMINDTSTVDVVEVVHGRWVFEQEFGDGTADYKCSVCEYDDTFVIGNFVYRNYCPNCGAKMDGGNEDD